MSGFCISLSKLSLTSIDQALAILLFLDRGKIGVVISSGELAKTIYKSGLGNPHSTRLAASLKQSGKVLCSTQGFALKDIARSNLTTLYSSILAPDLPSVDQDNGYLPKAVWHPTRGFIHKVCEQLNGCYHFGYYDGTNVLIRRLIETLIIECYTALKRETEIRGTDGNTLMLRDLVNVVLNKSPLNLGRDAKKALPEIKELGDRSAHAPRFNAVKADLDKIQSGLRLLVDELIHIWGVRP